MKCNKGITKQCLLEDFNNMSEQEIKEHCNKCEDSYEKYLDSLPDECDIDR